MVVVKDFELVKEYLDGSEIAFNKLINKYQKDIYWLARRMLSNHLDADDVTQEVIIVLYKKLNTFKFNSSLKTWIYKITQTRCLNYLKKRKLRQFLQLEDYEVKTNNLDNDIIKNTEDKDKLNNVMKALDSLPIKQRQVFVLRHFDELSYEEISEITGRSVGGLKANYFHAAKKIFRIIKDEK